MSDQHRAPPVGAKECWATAAALEDVPTDGMIGVTLEGAELALFNLGGEIFATSNICTHAQALLTEGWLEQGVVECPLHAGRFDVRTGAALGPPVVCDLKTYRVRVTGNSIKVEIS